MGIFEKFKLGFKKSADSISSGLREIIVKKEIDDETLNKIEEFLISSDVGIDASAEIKSIISQRKIDPKKKYSGGNKFNFKRIYLRVDGALRKKRFF
jgi:fused signal recognition particle receptor